MISADAVAKPRTAYPCPTCGGATRVLFTRMWQGHGFPYAHRRRRCDEPTCGEQFNTQELPAERVRALQAAAKANTAQLAEFVEQMTLVVHGTAALPASHIEETNAA